MLSGVEAFKYLSWSPSTPLRVTTTPLRVTIANIKITFITGWINCSTDCRFYGNLVLFGLIGTIYVFLNQI